MTGNLYWKSPNWRDDRTLVHRPFYKKKLALKPVTCSDGTKVWFKFYYSYYRIWTASYEASTHQHTDFIENISEAEYIVRKLADNL